MSMDADCSTVVVITIGFVTSQILLNVDANYVKVLKSVRPASSMLHKNPINPGSTPGKTFWLFFIVFLLFYCCFDKR